MIGYGVGVAAEEEVGGSPGRMCILDEGTYFFFVGAAVAAAVVYPAEVDDSCGDSFLCFPVCEWLKGGTI